MNIVQKMNALAIRIDRQHVFGTMAQIIDTAKRAEVFSVILDELRQTVPSLEELYGESNVLLDVNESSKGNPGILLEIRSASWLRLEVNLKGEIYFDFDLIQPPLSRKTRVGFNWEEDMIRAEAQEIFLEFFKWVYQLCPTKSK